YCQGKGWRDPSYETWGEGDAYFSIVLVKRTKFHSSSCPSGEEAETDAANKALAFYG
ncbi:hypothetical protein OnM2_103036, partial [Erysiphe neolycopersici]